MNDDLARFTAIRGIGKRTDARLHEAGVATWHSLAEVLIALSTIREASSERLGEMGRQAAKRASRNPQRAATEARDVERPHGFVVEITFDQSGAALRSSVTDVRAEREQQWAGWEPASLIGFIEQQTGLDRPTATAPVPPARPTRSRRPAGRRAAAAAERPTRSRRPGRRGTPPAERPAEQPASSTFGLGRTIGGRRRTVEVVVGFDDTGAALPSSGDQPVTELDATLGLRALGQSTVKDLARTSAATTQPELTLEFPSVDIPPGIHNLVVDLVVKRAAGGAAPIVRDVRVA
jgi:hypothetical protein